MIRLRPVDCEAEREGVWQEYYGHRLKIASVETPEYERELQLALRQANGADWGDIRSQHKILAPVAARAVLKDWDVKIDGEEIPFSVEEAEKVLLADYKTFKFVYDVAKKEANYKAEERKKIGKKPQNRSHGTSSTEKTLSS